MNVVERIEQATAPSVADIQNLTRSDVAHQAHARAYDRMERLSIDCRSGFAELYRAEADLKKLGIEINVKLPFPLSEAWFDWRAKQVLKT